MSDEPLKKKRKVVQPKALNSLPSGLKPKHTLYVNNIADHIGPERLRTNLYLMFSIYGEVMKVSFNTKKQRGQAFVTMRTVDESNLAMISLNNEPFFGKPLRIAFSRQDTNNL